MSSSRRRRTQQPDPDDHDAADTTMVDGPAAPDDVHNQVAKNLVRYALACDLQRMPIRRQTFRDKFMAQHPRAWKRAFDLAQKKLAQVFGLELRQLPIREKLTMEEKRKAAASANAHVASKAPDSYILVSILPDSLRTPSLVPPSHAPTAEAEATYAGFYTLIVTLVLLHGGEMTEAKLRRFLGRMNADTHLGTQRTTDVLARMERHGYVVKKIDKDGLAGGAGADDERNNTSYLVGPRAKVEMAPENVAQFVRAVYGESTPEIEKQIAASLGTEFRSVEAADAGAAEDGEEMDLDEPTAQGRSARR
ncbi:hypothetical protein BROUX41_001880 [Berkeleyomyces rouxiae]|uniref:uncharacterized protein n=1 Tax=Berkeleyomyces rouxiae TaxID=2035830 RepID=UPI003B774FEC